jgi:hypothetical protein
MVKKVNGMVSPTTKSQSASSPNEDRISSPISTGESGTFFEQHVDAYWLAQLLVHGIPPIILESVIEEVHLQTEHLGWQTDDFLIVGKNGKGDSRKLVGQVKRTFTVSSMDDECKKTVQDFWKDFKNSKQFSPDTDRFALVTLRGTNTLLEHFSGLLDCSRSARDGTEFESRLASPGFISKKAVHYCEEIQTIISEIEGKNVSAAEVWPFLRVIHILSLDLNSPTRQTESMIKTLLAHTTGEQDTLGAAESTWNALLREVGEGMPGARSYLWDDLPEGLRQRHSSFGSNENQALRALRDHSTFIVDGIRSTIGDKFHLRRGRLVQKVIEQLESTQVVLVSGPAGSGKSGIAKDVLGILAQDHFAFSFRAEEFAHPHFDETLQKNQIPATAALLGAILASQGRKVLLVESVERLLEASTRDAFTDLLTLVIRDKSWRLVLTCRDYSADLVRTCFLESANIGHSVVIVPELSDEELEEVKATYPTLVRPLADAALRRLLRNPYILDKALQIPWSEKRPLPQSEREFRSLFWQRIVRINDHIAGGMPRRRDETFVQIALRRARELTMFASCDHLDAEVVDALRGDSLVVSSPHSNVMVAPAHDILEDWAILQWIDEQHAMHEGSMLELSTSIGTYPAVRRTYRKWVSELVERDTETANRVFEAIVHEGGLPAQFRDDTLVSLLRSSASAAFLAGHSTELFANDKQLLRRVIHLLRVACVTTPTWLDSTATQGSLFNIPDAPSWAYVLALVHRNLELFISDDCELLLGFIEDWARGVSPQNPYPEGADSAVVIAYWLLPNFDDYDSEKLRKRSLKVIAKVPNVDRAHFTALLQGTRDEDERDRLSEEFREIIFEDVEGNPAARDIPEVIIPAAKNYLLESEDGFRQHQGFYSPIGLESLFGIKYIRIQFFPPSAYRGPFLNLLRAHPRIGLDFFIAVFNHSIDWYAHPRMKDDAVEPPFQLLLTFADGTAKNQWYNARLWNMYRGFSVGPYVLQSLLMALERWLLEYADARPGELDDILLNILHKSDSAALTAVVASVATAFPHSAGETLLVLLRSKVYILLDRGRLAMEFNPVSRIRGLSFRNDPNNVFYEEERKESDALPQRHRDLEIAISNLQLGPLAPRVHEILDRYRHEMPPVEQQNEDDRIWRLAMHRMDLRQYDIAEDSSEVPNAPEGHISPEKDHKYIRLEPKDLEPDVKEMVDKNTTQLHAVGNRNALLVWGMKIFNKEESSTYDPTHWRQMLQLARAADVGDESLTEYDLGRGGDSYVAVVCVRDHWEDMSQEERYWCVEVICSEVEREGDRWEPLARMQLFSMSSDRPCAWVVPLLLGKELDDEARSKVCRSLVVAMTHAINEVHSYAASGIGQHLWIIDRKLALRCTNALAMEAMFVQKTFNTEIGKPMSKRRQINEIETEAASIIRQRFFESGGIPDDACQKFDPTQWFGAEYNIDILTILGQARNESVAVAAFEQLGHTLVKWWDEDDDRRRDRSHDRPERNYETESKLTTLLENFLLKTTPMDAAMIIKPIVDAIDRHPDKIYWILMGLIGNEDQQPNTEIFWSLWKLFADKVLHAAWLERIDHEHTIGKEMVSAIFLGSWWNEDVRHWKSLEGHAGNIHALFDALPASSTVMDDYLRFLYYIGGESLPEAFNRIASRLQEGDAKQMLRKGNTVFLLEVLLQRYVYGRPQELKRQDNLRKSVLFLLDVLVEHGSSAAFRMRDDFVTPISIP